MTEARTAAIILAAGESRRMGTPKQLLPIRGQPLLVRTLSAVRDTRRFSDIIIVTGAHAAEIEFLVKSHSGRCVPNPAWRKGLSTSVQAGLANARAHDSSIAGVLFVLCDQPELTRRAIDALLDEAQSHSTVDLVAARYGGHFGAPVWLRSSAFSLVATLTGDQGLRPLFPQFGPDKIRGVDLPELAADIDTPEDYARHRSR